MIRHLHVPVLVASMLLTGCSCEQSPQSPIIRRKPLEMPYPYNMSQGEKEQFLKRVRTLRAGEAYEVVLNALGPPYSESAIQAKGPNSPVRGTSIKYYLRKLGRGVNDKYDQCVSLNFDNDKRLTSVDTNVAELTFGSLTGLNTGMAHMDEAGKPDGGATRGQGDTWTKREDPMGGR